MAQTDPPPPAAPVLEYGQPRRRRVIHWPVASFVALIGLGLNVLPWFIPPPLYVADAVDPQLGWPRVFLWSGGFAGGSQFYWQPLAFDAAVVTVAALAIGFAAARLAGRTPRPAGGGGAGNSTDEAGATKG